FFLTRQKEIPQEYTNKVKYYNLQYFKRGGLRMRASILKLATKISIECGTYTGVTPNDPEYKILEPVVTDEMAEIAMGLKVRKYVSAEQVAKKVKKPLGRVKE